MAALSEIITTRYGRRKLPFKYSTAPGGRLRARFDDMKPLLFRIRKEDTSQPYPPV